MLCIILAATQDLQFYLKARKKIRLMGFIVRVSHSMHISRKI